MKNYTIKLSVQIIEGDDSAYYAKKPLQFEVKENLPTNVDPEKYIKQRLAEEVRRNFASLVDPIDNKTEEAQEGADPLAA
ncbi:MAG TPA: hypothetical protein VFM34_05075 [Moraxellaceae bacterium]|nr:hypothetical protein [Moraxellaceae bacterium]